MTHREWTMAAVGLFVGMLLGGALGIGLSSPSRAPPPPDLTCAIKRLENLEHRTETLERRMLNYVKEKKT